MTGWIAFAVLLVFAQLFPAFPDRWRSRLAYPMHGLGILIRRWRRR